MDLNTQRTVGKKVVKVCDVLRFLKPQLKPAEDQRTTDCVVVSAVSNPAIVVVHLRHSVLD